MDLDDFLTDEERRHYERFLGAGSLTVFVHPDPYRSWQWTATTVSTGQPQAFRYAAIAAVQELPVDDTLVPAGRGPDAASSSQALTRSPEICWDVCGYYRRLRLPWTATKKQIRTALFRSKATIGAGRAHLIYAAKQLLDEGIRARYDRMPLGGVFLEDKDVQDRIKRAAHRAASAMAARGFSHVTPESVLGEWGFSVNHPGGPQGEGRGRQAPPPASPLRPGLFPPASEWLTVWSWYREPAAEDAFGLRAEELETWQLLLVRAFAARGLRARFAVGLCAGPGFRIRPAPDQGTLVVLLGEGGPSPELAAAAVDAWAR